jgi:flagellar hook-basal body complex protein FliE
MRPIASFQPPPKPISPLAASQAPKSGGLGPFGELLVDKVEEVNAMQTHADDLIHTRLTGGDVSEAEALTAIQKADLAFRMLLQVRNKLIEAYREVQQIQI